jgi:hypothetical protein
MLNSAVIRLVAAGLFIVSVSPGAALAQECDKAPCRRYINSGLFSVSPGEGVNVHVSIDDVRGTAPIGVTLRLFDPRGVVVARDEVVLQAGESATLRYQQPGLYRAQIVTAAAPPSSSARRAIIGSLEIVSGLSPAASLAPQASMLSFTPSSVRYLLFLNGNDARTCNCPD